MFKSPLLYCHNFSNAPSIDDKLRQTGLLSQRLHVHFACIYRDRVILNETCVKTKFCKLSYHNLTVSRILKTVLKYAQIKYLAKLLFCG